MISRLTRTAQTLAVVLLAYFAYALIAAPLIEPTIATVRPKWEPNSHNGLSRIDLALFPPGAWERAEPKVLETSQGTLLFDDYVQLENGDLKLPRCTLISYIDPPQSDELPEGPPRALEGASIPAPVAGPARRAQRRPVVMRASKGALLRFDSPPNFMLGKFSRLVGGQLEGDVTIFSPASNAKSDDSLLITTKNIQIDQQRIWAPSQVNFRFGRNQAKGRDLSIHLDSPQRGADKKAAMGRIRSLELMHVDEVNLQFDGDLFAMATGKQEKNSPPSEGQTQPNSDRPPTPIEIKCQGPFRFDFDALVASLEERVDVIRHNLDGPSDQLNCELLEIHLMPKTAGPAHAPPPVSNAPDSKLALTTKSRPGSMQPKKIIAVGFPVIIRAPSMAAGARAKRMEFDFISRRVELSGDEKTILFRDQTYVEAPRLEYELLEGGRLGRLQAAGPGLVRGQLGKEKRAFEATWAGSVSLLPQGRNKVLSLLGQANLTMADTASLKADALHIYLLEVPRPHTDEVDIHADRMLASGNIELDSPQLIAFLAEAQIWFREPTASELVAERAVRPAGRRPSGLFGSKTGTAERPKKLRLDAGVLRGQVVMTEKPQLEALDLQNNVHVNEFQPVAKSTLDIAAQRVVLERGNAPTAELTLSGAPARFSAEGMTLDGTLIRVQLANNVAQVEGPGSMRMLPKHVALGTSGKSKPLKVNWKRGMHFDGRMARFEGEIETRGGHVTKAEETIAFVANGDVLEVVLNRPIEFTDPATTGVDASRLSFLGMSRVDSRTVDRTGTLTSIDSLVVRDLVMNRQTGDVTGQGPGNLIHRGPNPEKEKRQTGQLPELVFLRVDFENQMVGNLDSHEIQFLNGTRTIFGPIANWEQSLDPQRPEMLGEGSAILTSRRLAVADMRIAADDQNAVEVEATGNAHIQGRQFTASGDRVSYIRAKDQLVLEGVGRTKSTLEFQRQAGAAWQKLSAKKILFYPRTRQFALDGFELELNDLELPSRNSPPGTYLPTNGDPRNYAPQGYRPAGPQPYPRALPPQANRNLPTRSAN